MIRQLDGERGQAEMMMYVYVADICQRDLAIWTEDEGRLVRPVYANTMGPSRLQGKVYLRDKYMST